MRMLCRSEVDAEISRICCVPLWPVHCDADEALMANLEALLWNVSDPSHQLYGRHLSKTELDAHISSKLAGSQREITAWLQSSPLAPLQLVSREEQLRENSQQLSGDEAASPLSSLCVSAGGDWLNVCSSVDKIERLFQTELAIFSRGSTDFRTPTAQGAQNATSFSTLPSAPDTIVKGVRASTDLSLPPHILAVVDFIGGINTPIHMQPRIASIGRRAMRHHARRSHKSRNHHKKDSDTPDDSCEIPAAFLEFVPPALVAAPASVTDTKASLAPRVLDETQAGHEQVFVRFAVGCTMDAKTDDDRSCASRIRSFNFIVQPLQTDAALREATLPVVAASLPLELAHCIPSGDNPGSSVCEAVVPLSNYQGVWLTVQSVLTGAAATDPAAASAAYSCVRGPFFPRALIGSAALRDLYSIPSWLTAGPASHIHGGRSPSRSGLAIEEFLETFFNHRDLNDYLLANGAPADGEEVVNQQPDVEDAALPASSLESAVQLQPQPRPARSQRNHQRRRHAPTLVGFNNETEAVVTGDEAQLDIQIVAGLLSPDTDADPAAAESSDDDAESDSDGPASPLSRIWMWSIPGRESPNPEEPFLSWLLTLSSLQSPPLVHSLSYGDMEEALPRWYMQRINREMMKLALRGVTIIFPAGDKGAASDWEPTADACQKHHPEFPVSSPFVLAVGATQFARQTQDDALCRRVYAHAPLCSSSGSGAQEVACSAATGGEITTGGGFSEHWSRPPWQAAAVSRYLRDASHLPKGEGFFKPADSRAYPDISAMGTAFVTINKGQIVPASGTSASVPLIAAIIAMLNDLRLSRGEPPLGLVAPLLYSLSRTHPHVFRDVTSGDNRCRLQDQTCCARGFKATKGWDAVSGLGTLRVDVLASILAAGYPIPLAADADNSSSILGASSLLADAAPESASRAISVLSLLPLLLCVTPVLLLLILWMLCRAMSTGPISQHHPSRSCWPAAVERVSSAVAASSARGSEESWPLCAAQQP